MNFLWEPRHPIPSSARLEIEARARAVPLPAALQRVPIPVWGIPKGRWEAMVGKGFKKSTWVVSTSGYVHVRLPMEDLDWLPHELGHVLWYRLMTGQEQFEFTAYWQKAVRGPILRFLAPDGTIGKMPSAYAKKNATEGFGECFQAHVTRTRPGLRHAGLGPLDVPGASHMEVLLSRIEARNQPRPPAL